MNMVLKASPTFRDFRIRRQFCFHLPKKQKSVTHKKSLTSCKIAHQAKCVIQLQESLSQEGQTQKLLQKMYLSWHITKLLKTLKIIHIASSTKTSSISNQNFRGLASQLLIKNTLFTAFFKIGGLKSYSLILELIFSILLLSLFRSSTSMVSSSLYCPSSSEPFGSFEVVLRPFFLLLRVPLLVSYPLVTAVVPVSIESNPTMFPEVLFPISISLSKILNCVLRFLISPLQPAISRFFFFLRLSYLGDQSNWKAKLTQF